MKRNLAFLLIMTSATLAQTPAVTTKPPVKPSAVKVVPQSGPKMTAVKVSVAPAAKPATVSVQVAPAKPAAGTKPAAAASAKPAMPQAAKVAVSGTAVKTVPTNSKVAATPVVVAGKPIPAPAKVAVVNAKVPQAAAKKVAEVKVPVKEAAKPVAVKVPVKPVVATKGQTTVAVQDTKTSEGDTYRCCGLIRRGDPTGRAQRRGPRRPGHAAMCSSVQWRQAGRALRLPSE